jgi:hypothetical protein
MRILLGWTAAALCVALLVPVRAEAQKETPSAQATRKRLAKKISVEWDNVPLKVALEDIRSELDDKVSIKIDNASGVSNNTKVKLKADNQPAKKVLDDLCTKYEWGYIVLSDRKDRRDGFVIIRKSNERGYEKGKEPKGTKGASSAAPNGDGTREVSRLDAPVLRAAPLKRRTE